MLKFHEGCSIVKTEEKEAHMLLYHGSSETVEFPEIRKARFNKDFYFGFYCTQYREQAVRWASRYGKTGFINTYEYTPDCGRAHGR